MIACPSSHFSQKGGSSESEVQRKKLDSLQQKNWAESCSGRRIVLANSSFLIMADHWTAARAYALISWLGAEAD